MEELLRKRSRILAKLKRISTFVEQADESTTNVADLQIRIDMLSDIWAEFDTTQTQIECSCEDSQLEEQQSEQEEFESNFCNAKSKLMLSIERKSQCTPTSTIQNESAHRAPANQTLSVKLPSIELPTFSGDFRQWTSFKDLFNSVIHNNSSLSSVQKLHYLKSAVIGEAARLLKSIAITEANYTEAWKILSDRFSNKKQIVQSHLRTMYSQTKLTHESARDIRKLLDTTVENTRALFALGLPTDQWDHLLIYLITERLDVSTRRQWEIATADCENPTFDEIKNFLEKRCRALEATTAERVSVQVSVPSKHNKQQSTIAYHSMVSKCVMCKESHPIYKCEQFLKLSVLDKFNLVKTTDLCINCLRSGHTVKNCKSSACRKCQKYHNTLLHRDVTPIDQNAPASQDNTSVSYHATKHKPKNHVLLATAVLRVLDNAGSHQSIRALLDSGSQATFITEACVQRLGLRSHRSSMEVTGLGNSGVGTCKGTVNLQLSSICSPKEFHIQAYMLPRITGSMPSLRLNHTLLNDTIERYQLQLADPDYYKQRNIDMLLGADVYYDMLLAGKIRDPSTNLILQNTSIGWIIAGTIHSADPTSRVTTHLAVENLNVELKQFWELEEIPQPRIPTKEETECEGIFSQTTIRTNTGRFMVNLPFNDQKSQLGNGKEIAMRRLLQLERRLDNQPNQKEEYIRFMREYLELGHMEPVRNTSSSESVYYLPHHYVLRDQSTSTRLRVVFDGSAQPTNGISLNQALIPGPSIQEDLVNIVTRFRIHNIVFTADISKMYRQILVSHNHRNYQRIFWREQPNCAIKEYQLNTVTYGTASAPFLAMRCLRELASIGRDQYPLAAAIISRDFYVDDVMSGNDTIQEAVQAQNQLIALMESAGFQLHKWASNNPELLANISQASIGSSNLSSDSCVKTLGIKWNSASDLFTFQVLPAISTIITKRSILSYISKLFDPLGWVAPVVVKAKLMIQRLWLVSVGWDDKLPVEICEEWSQYTRELPSIAEITVPRQIVINSSVKLHSIHGFSDASEAAYGAVVYIRSVHEDNISIHLVCSKSKVAPLKKISVPRLELCGAVLLARLMRFVTSTLSISIQHTTAWTDSTIVLSWLDKHPHHWKTFVANRVTEIHEMIPPENWRHTRSEDNPADCLSRGVSPSQLKHHNLWWHGPSWLQLPEGNWPARSYPKETSNLESKIQAPPRVLGCTAALQDNTAILTKHSSLTKILRITAYCFRFIKNCRAGQNASQVGPLSARELHDGLLHWVRLAQTEHFSSDIAHCLEKTPLPRGSLLQSLNPFVDDVGILRVGGRIQEAHVPYAQKHPIILPERHILSDLIITTLHLRYLHAGPQLLLAIIRTKYWILKAKNRIRKLLYQCHKCFRLRVQTSQQLMGNLPLHRLEPVRPFIRCGVDYAGPMALRSHKGRGNIRTSKAYICIFVCFTTRAVHIELVSDLTTDAFLAALHRFVARRGRPSDIYSDCGTNFVGAKRQLQDLSKLVSSSTHNQLMSKKLSEDCINWHFSPPLTPHYGGLWEAGVKSIKFHLRRTVGLSVLTYEELYTVLTRVEACLNSRPLCPLSTDPDDLSALTPGHFLIGAPLTTVPDPDLTQLSMNRLSRWQLISRLSQQFWHRWSREYLARLQQRPKWVKALPNLKVGDLVLLKEPNINSLSWPMARIVKTHPGKDDLVRVVTVKTAKGLFKRHISNCSVLPIEGT